MGYEDKLSKSAPLPPPNPHEMVPSGLPWEGYYFSDYGIAVKHGFHGTEQEWLASLRGPQGDKGDAYRILGLYATLADLEAAHPTGNAGDAYAVGTDDDNTTYNWDVDAEAWVNIGSFRGPQGETGETGATGAAAGFGTVNATVDGNTGTPGVNVLTSGPDTAKNITFEFANLKGETGATGADGAPGADGVSPEVTIDTITGGHSVTITDADHPGGQSFNVMDGEDGADGNDGVSPGVSVSPITGGHTVTITDAEHPSGQSFNVMDGADGTSFVIKGLYATLADLILAHPIGNAGDAYAVGTSSSNTTYIWDVDENDWTNIGSIQGPPGQDGQDGQDGAPGQDGVSPEVSVSSITGGHSVTITDADHPSGQTFNVMDGEDGAPGQNGQDGVPGPNEVSSSTDTALNGVLFGNGSKVGAKTLDTSSLTDDNNHVPTSGVVKSALDAKADKNDLATIHQTSPTCTETNGIAAGVFFYLDNELVVAKTAIANGATFTMNTNYEHPTAGSLNALKSAIGGLGNTFSASDLKTVSINTETTIVSKQLSAGTYIVYGLITLMNIVSGTLFTGALYNETTLMSADVKTTTTEWDRICLSWVVQLNADSTISLAAKQTASTTTSIKGEIFVVQLQ